MDIKNRMAGCELGLYEIEQGHVRAVVNGVLNFRVP
jgi:hypothetical protein